MRPVEPVYGKEGSSIKLTQMLGAYAQLFVTTRLLDGA